MRILAAFACVVMLVLAGADRSHAETRIALVIGNRDYGPGVGPLTNPLNDIRVVGDALKSVGFTVLDPLKNATRAQMLRAIYNFASALRSAGPDAIGFLYYSGHGVASGGENYLIPVDVTEPSSMQLSIQGVRQSEILGILRNEAPNAAQYLVLDACRNTLQGARGAKGFIAVGQESGVLIAFSTEPGRTALDAGTGSGPYAAALAAELAKPGQNDLLMFHNVRVDVMDKTNGDQVPWTEDGIELRDRPVFARALPSAEQPSTSSPVVNTSDAAQAWAATQGTTNPSVLEEFIRRYGDSYYAALARARLQDLKVAAIQPSIAPQDDKVAISDPGLLKELRDRLYELNFDPGPLDGPLTEASRQAIREFEQQSHLAETGNPTMELLHDLREAHSLKPWGAIVYAPSEEKWGMSWATDSRKDAVATARASCGSAKCTTEVSFFGSECGAFAHSGGVWAIVARDGAERAKDAALADCRKRGNACHIVGAVCADGSERSK